jgi:hypothetical protein
MKLQYFQLLKPIVTFLYLKLIKDNAFLLILCIIIGISARIITLIGFAITLQAFIAAIRPDVILSFSNKLLVSLGFDLEIQVENLVHILILIIILIYGLNFLFHIIYSKILKKYIFYIVNDKEKFMVKQTMDDDIFLVEEVPPVIQSMIKSLEVIMFMTLVIVLISLLVPVLVLLLLPVLMLLVFIQVVADRAKLRDLEHQKKARQCYVNFKDVDGKLRRRLSPEINIERDRYLQIRDKRRHKALIKPQFDVFVGAIATSIVIYYLFKAQLDVEQLAGLLIIFVVGIRNVIASGRELSVSISRLLELRKHIPTLERLTKG